MNWDSIIKKLVEYIEEYGEDSIRFQDGAFLGQGHGGKLEIQCFCPIKTTTNDNFVMVDSSASIKIEVRGTKVRVR